MKETRQISKEIRKFAEQLATRSRFSKEENKEQTARKGLERFRKRSKPLEGD